MAMTAQERAESIAAGLREAEEVCARLGLRLTRLRREIFSLLLAAEGPVKAYGLIEQMRERGEHLTPPSIYRTLDFLLRCGLAHRVNSINAYVPCTGSHHEQGLLLFVCSECQRAEELEDPALYASIRDRLGELGLSLRDNSIEIQGRCRDCART